MEQTQKSKKIDNYVMEEVLGSGQFGDVYKGLNIITQEHVAIKTIKREILKDAKFYELLENEIKVLKACNNENIIKLYDIKKTSNNIYLIIEYCNNGDLSQYLKKLGGKVPEKDAIQILKQVFNAFTTLKAENIMHRDFKPQNVLIHNGKIKVADFGFCKLLGNSTQTSTMLGSPLNMAPEIMNGTPYGVQADIWSVGVAFYEILFGDYPFKGKNIDDQYYNITHKSVQFPDEIPVGEATKQIIKKMLVVDPKARATWDEQFTDDIFK